MKEQPKQQQQANKLSISELPTPILVNILSRLPLKTIHICKCVCKFWLNLFSDPYFAETHFKISDTCILAHPFLINWNPKRKSPFVLDWVVPNLFDRYAIVKFDPNAMLLSNNCIMASSCNGLVCLMCPLLCGAYCVCNPISGEYVMVPPKTEWGCEGMISFGLSPKSNKYKIVLFSGRFDDRNLKMWMIDVFTIGTDNTWRSIEKSLYLSGDPAGAFLNGRFHWIVTDCNDSEFVRYFDFDCEGFQSVSPPKEFGPDHKKRSELMKLEVMDDCLCLCDYSGDSYIDIWAMKEYGIRESWTKKLVISASVTYTAWLKNSWPMLLLDNGECLIFCNHKMMVSYNLKEKRFSRVEVGTTDKKIDAALAYKPSFILLEEIARRQNWKVVDIHRHIW